MVRNLLIRGMLAGIAAAALAFVFAHLVGEPSVDAAIAYEDGVTAAAGEHEHDALVSRNVQSTLGLAVALLVYGVAVGGIFALVYAAVYGRLSRVSPRATAAVLAGVGCVTVILVPMLKYPSNPPASSADGTISSRTNLYVLMLVLSVAAAVAAAIMARRLTARLGPWNAALTASVGYVVAMVAVGLVMPGVSETPADFPAVVLYDFRLATFGIHLVLWAVIGLVFGSLIDGRFGGVNRSRESVSVGSV